MKGPIVLLKAHVSGYRRKDGTPVSDYERGSTAAARPSIGIRWPFKVAERALSAAPPKVVAAAEKPAPNAFQQKFGGGGFKSPQYGLKVGPQSWATPPKPKAWHPKKNDRGEAVGIHQPHAASSAASWSDNESTATVIAGGQAPAELHGVPFNPWADAPTTLDGWDDVPGQANIDEPDFECPPSLEPAAGVVIQEPDGRVWLVSPTNGFGGYRNTFPKGRADDGLSLQATAIKEAYEESGLQVEITGHLGDFARTKTYTRYYMARRVGGSPADMGWESQAVRLAPAGALHQLLNGHADQPVREALTG